MYLNICTARSVRKKKDLVIETAWNGTLSSRPVAAPPSDRKNCGVHPSRTNMDFQFSFVAVRKDF